MGSDRVIVIADSSPLIYLSRVGALDVLRLLYGEVVVPAVVWAEVVEMRPNAPGAEVVKGATWLRVPEVEPEPTDLGLDPGETAAIVLAEALGADLLLIDERAGRAVAVNFDDIEFYAKTWNWRELTETSWPE